MVKRGHKLESGLQKHELTWLIMVGEHVKTRTNMVMKEKKKTCANMVQPGHSDLLHPSTTG